MGRADTITKNYVRRNDIFSDIFNYYLYGGKQVIRPDHMKELDITEIALPYSTAGKASVQKYRDVLKALQIMEDEKAVYVLLGTELESKINYAMPPKNMLYDAIKYVEQVSDIAKTYSLKKGKGLSGDEFLSGFTKRDKLLPVITLVIYFGSKKWDAPMSLHEMFDADSQELLRFVPDYRINLISPEAMDASDFEKFHTEFRKVMKFIKYSRNKNELRVMLDEDKSFEIVDRETVDVINAVTNTNLKITGRGKAVNMCKAVRDLIEEGRNEGWNEGRNEGWNEGRNEGENRMGNLIEILLNQGRMEDVGKAAKDPEYRNQLFREFQIA